MKFQRILLLLLTLVSPALCASPPPNIVFVITDDQGYGDLACLGNPILETPHLDQLHSESSRLTDYHVSPTCAPTRGALMSAHYTNRCGPWHTVMGRSFLFEGEKTFGDTFSAHGYTTGMFGKWHLGDNYPFRPEDRGFTEVVRHGAGGVGQSPDNWDNAYFDDTYFHNGSPKKFSGYCTDVYFREAKRFIKESIAHKKPFLAYISPNAPHGPFHCPEKYWQPYVPLLKDQLGKNAERVAIFYGMIANIDENIGNLRSWLTEQGLSDNTIFIFTTDNGTASGEKIFNSGMKGKKGSAYDGGHRVPFFIHWPNGGLTKGTDIPQLTAHIDILPTLLDLSGLPPLEDSYQPDGLSLAPLLKNPEIPWQDRTIITDSQRVRDPIKWRQSSTMTQRWRLINGEELYDITADPGQTQNIAAKHPAVVKKLRADYDAWWADISPVFSTDARVIIGTQNENPIHLTSHDWLTNDRTVPWNQQQIRAGQEGTGKWALRVAEAGKYRITLRRWPAQSGANITASIPAGAPVPGLIAFREEPGKAIPAKSVTIEVANFSAQKPVTADDSGITFDVDLPAGDTYLTGTFIREDGTKIGTYYVEIEKL
ncbi:MAG: arylsulfatase [Verrucomicrobiota bacterium]